MFIDTHCHPYLSKKRDIQEAYKNFIDAGGQEMICIATDPDDSLICIQIAADYAHAHASIGIHPCSIGFDGESLDLFLENLKNTPNLIQTVGILEDYYKKHSSNIVAIGECGLDYHWLDSISKKNNVAPEKVKQLQKYYFKAQIQLAKKLSLPFIIHNRNSGEDVWDILCEENYGNFILHSFAENLEYAQKCIQKFPDSKISFSGILTFKNAPDVKEAAKHIPLKNILIETDSPYLTPEPLRGKDENQASYTMHVLDHLIDLRSESPEEIEKQVYQNSLDIFKIS